jgi:phytoene dehydrogenase-like protein
LASPDYIFVGSGINALVAASLLARKGRKVLILERNAEIGGCLRSEEIIAPGFVHDVMATTFVLFITSPAYAALAEDLGKRGLEFCHTDTPSGVLLPDGRSLILTKDHAKNISAFESLCTGDGASFSRDVGSVGRDAPLLFSLLGNDLWSFGTAKLLAKELWARGARGLAGFFGEALVPARNWLESTYGSEVSRAMFAPWVLHTGLGPESSYSGQMGKIIAFALEAAGAPIVKGGAIMAVQAFSKLIEDHGGNIRTHAEVAAILRDKKGAACGVRLSDGTDIFSGSGVIASTTPDQLYQNLLADLPLPLEKQATRTYRYGKGNMQIHYALKTPPKWKSEQATELAKVALLHLTPGLDGVSRASNECERSMLPAVPTICVGQPHALDTSRCPEGAAILWLQLPETPRFLKGDAADEIDIPADGQWTPALREAYADRVEAILAHHIENFADIVVGRKAYSPADLERMNGNLVGGDPYGGYCGLDQFFLWRPFKHSRNHETPVPKLYHIGASTHPGPGLGAGSGFIIGHQLP